MPARKPKTDEKSQSARFIEKAREIGASEDTDDFERTFKQVVRPRTSKTEAQEKKK